ncbi:MAG: hypothetical protein Q7R83_04585 [bacterium]|nr:hypothetical protein [bacterium]
MRKLVFTLALLLVPASASAYWFGAGSLRGGPEPIALTIWPDPTPPTVKEDEQVKPTKKKQKKQKKSGKPAQQPKKVDAGLRSLAFIMDCGYAGFCVCSSTAAPGYNGGICKTPYELRQEELLQEKLLRDKKAAKKARRRTG